ncbi:response regulator [Emticicia agri]|uniref:Response regulator n=1 Tax=Emticicia agri TaxID=2492393 RepID=A0A4Q5LSM7_9BACT|nr:response regulator [Emticicia agri]RYU92598.1 response regulator [Emticicia agri]
MNHEALINKHDPIEILLAEDDADDSLFFSEALAQIPVLTNLTVVNDGVEAINYINNPSSTKPHIIFLDLNMPKMKGLDCLEQIRKNKLYNETPCVIITTSASPNDISKSYSNGANLYFAKPVSMIDLVRMIDKALRVNWKHFFPPFEDTFFVTERRI